MRNRFAEYHLAQDAQLVTKELPGPKSKALLERQAEIEGSIVSYPKGAPLAFKRAKGATIEDVDGNVFLDFFGGCGVVNVGHCNPDVLKYVEEQEKELIHALDFPTENKLGLIEKVLDLLPAYSQ